MTGPTRQLTIFDGENNENLYRVAFASSNREWVDQHFGSSQGFSIYGVSADKVRLLTVAQFEEREQDGNEDKLISKLELLDGCIAVYCRACGASAVRQLLAVGVQPVKVADAARIDELIADLQAELRAGPSAWLAKAIQRAQIFQDTEHAKRFELMAAQGWEE
jgi:nitrogen fixation protein NifX